MNDGDWICSDPNCGNINFSRRVSCYRCNKERPNGGKPFKKKLGTEIGKSAAEKSRGLFNADDWQCNKCANVNWARRSTCNVCNAPKFGEVEARTGYGGGYNERGVVEYRKREQSSDDEYDEFGRKKRKRKADAADTVGITEGPVIKRLPPTKQIKEPIMPAPPVIIAQKKKRDNEPKNGSLSDGSVCDVPAVPRLSYHKNVQYQSYNKRNTTHPLPKTNGFERKRYSSFSDKEQSGSSSHEGNAIKSNPVMENRVSSTNNDVVYKFTGPTPSEVFEVTYTLEERVRAAAYAIVYNNCKISTSKFESWYDKPAPDFKTIFAWRRTLLQTGCLIDNHIEKIKDVTERPPSDHISQANITPKKGPCKLPNPDEIILSSESEQDHTLNFQVNNKTLPFLPERSGSAETVLIDNMDMLQKNTATGSVSTVDGREMGRSQSSSTHNRTRSSSRDSQDTDYSESDVELIEPKDSNIKNTPSASKISKHSANDSDSDSFSYNSEEVDFRSRVFGDTQRPKRRFNKKNVHYKNNVYVPNTNQSFQGYTTQKPIEKSPLATGNIYMPNFHNMNIRNQVTSFGDTDGLSSEYVPTMMAATAKKHYQDFKNNVKKKGFWAKGNGSFRKNTSAISTVTSVAIDTDYRSLQQKSDKNKNDDFTKDEFDNIMTVDNYVSFGEPLGSTPNSQKVVVNNSRVFDVVQSEYTIKSKNIMDIFNTNDDNREKSPETVNDLDRYDNVRKIYENEWNDDDDDLYKDSDARELNTIDTNPVAPNSGFKPPHSPTSNMLYNESENQLIDDKGVCKEKNEKHCEKILDLLNDLQGNNDTHTKPTETINNQFEKEKLIIQGNDLEKLLDIPLPEPISTKLSDEIRQMSQESPESVSKNRYTNISPSKRVHVLESVTIKPKDSSIPITSQGNTEELCLLQTAETETNEKEVRKDIQIDNNKSEDITHKVPKLDLSNILSNINTDTLLLALQNLQQMSQPQHNPQSHSEGHDSSKEEDINSEQQTNLETINLTNDDWELDSIRHDSIERELQRLDGNSGDTPFLGDIFDPGPVTMPLNIAIKFNNSNKYPDDKCKSQTPHLNENAPVIGNFKSFALPKPVILNRLKLTAKQPDKNKKSGEGKRAKLKKKPTTSASQEGADAVEEDDEEESGDEADLAKYDLWGSDDEKNNLSKTDNAEDDKSENSKQPVEAVENNRTSPVERRRSRSSSSSSSTSSSSSSSHSSTNTETPKNKFDDFNLNSERESPNESPKGRKSGARSRSPRSPRSRSASASARRRSRDSRSAGETRTSRDKEWPRDRERRDRSRGSREKKERRYSREGSGNHYGGRGRHR